jgi:hypothetical protein
LTWNAAGFSCIDGVIVNLTIAVVVDSIANFKIRQNVWQAFDFAVDTSGGTRLTWSFEVGITILTPTWVTVVDNAIAVVVQAIADFILWLARDALVWHTIDTDWDFSKTLALTASMRTFDLVINAAFSGHAPGNGAWVTIFADNGRSTYALTILASIIAGAKITIGARCVIFLWNFNAFAEFTYEFMAHKRFLFAVFVDLALWFFDICVWFFDICVGFFSICVGILDISIGFFNISVRFLDICVWLLDIRVRVFDIGIWWFDVRVWVFDIRIRFYIRVWLFDVWSRFINIRVRLVPFDIA